MSKKKELSKELKEKVEDLNKTQKQLKEVAGFKFYVFKKK
jgi:hypothetical protein